MGANHFAAAEPWQELTSGKNQGDEWLVYGGDLGQMRYSPNDQINVKTVKNLKVKWMFQTGVLGSFENTPIVDDDVMYVTTPYNHVFALDAKTGKLLWHHEHKLGTTIFCCGPNNRGVAVLGDNVYMGTLDAMLIALDKKTGEVKWETQVADPEYGYSETHAPTIYKDTVILGISGGEYGIRGFISAYNAKTGELVWRTHTIPAPDDAAPDGAKGWEGVYVAKADGQNDLHRDIAAEKAAVASGGHKDAWKFGGAGNWMTNAVDPESGMIFATAGNPSPDLDGTLRPGDNRWSDSLLALKADTGEIVWAYQYVPHDVWDLDSVSPPILATAKDESGKMVPVVIHGGKTGWVYVHDRKTGKLIRRSKPMVPHENLFALPTEGEGTRMLPGANGGVEWSPGAFNPNTHMVYYVNLHQPMHYEVKSVPWEKGKLWLGGAFKAIPGEAQWGNVSAVNIDTGEIVWQQKTEQPMIGGTLTTKGGLVFAGEGNGLFKAYDAKSGKSLWSFQAGAGVNSAPMSFKVDGKQRIAVAAGGNFQLNFHGGDSIIVFGAD
ncbi:MAG: PQQ-binding-like beta-propeller repeat protein [Alphaproteobacteria bacterium]